MGGCLRFDRTSESYLKGLRQSPENEDSWWWFKRNSERKFNGAKTAAERNTEVTVVWTRWRSQLFSWHPNIIDFDEAGYWPLWQLRILFFYAFTLAGWVAYFSAFTWLHRRTDRGDRIELV